MVRSKFTLESFLKLFLSDETPESLEEKSAVQIASQSDVDDIPDPTSVTYTDYEDPFAFVSKFSGLSPHISKLSTYAWVGCGDDVYVLECLGKGFIRVERVEVTNGECLCGSSMICC